MIPRHTVPAAQFAALAGGRGGPEAVRVLARAQLSKRLLLIRYIAEQWIGDRVHCDAAVDTLAHAQRIAPDAVADLLADPLVGAWAAGCTRRLMGEAPDGIPLDAQCNHLSAIAVAAAAIAGIEARLVIPAIDGWVAVPRTGRAFLGDRSATATAVVQDGRVTVAGADFWQAPRHLAGRAVRIALDDVDPYRGGHHAPPAARLSGTEVDIWRRTFAAGWELIATSAPERAAELAAGLRTLVPLRLDGHSARSATIHDSFGAFGLTRPGGPEDFAVMLVHEFQHSKLNGLQYLRKLVQAGSTERHFAPWRPDPRPVDGLLQGVYAFLGVADFWRSAGLGEQFAVAREQVRWGLEALERSQELTPDGRRFTAGMRSTFDDMATAELPKEMALQAERQVWDTYDRWRSRNPGG